MLHIRTNVYKIPISSNGISNESPAGMNLSGLFLSVFALHRDRTEELYFITLVLILTACSPSRGNCKGDS